ncbi:MAG: hypothetical protein V3T64_06690, partial [Myxococcota bacterium]
MSPPRVARDTVAAISIVFSTAVPLFAEPPLDEPATFAGDVAPILLEHCVACHRPSGPAPSFLTYDEVRPWARSIARRVEARTMPPWLPAADSPPFEGDRRLDEAEIETLAEWVRSGAPRGDTVPHGDAVSPVVSLPPSGWLLGEPDLIVEMPSEFVLPAEGGETFRNFVLTVPLEERRFVHAAELRSDNPRVVHHAVLTVDRTDSSRSLDEDDPLPGFDGMRAFTRARSPSGHFVSWTPGKTAFVGYEGMAWELPAGADLVLETHLLPTGRAESIRARVGLYFAERRPSRQPVVLHLGSKTLDIPAGEPAHRIEESLTLPTDLRLLSIYPHAHYLGREMSVVATRPDGREQTLIHIARWDFNWQDQYRFVEPIDLQRGTRIRMVYTYDNSSQNPSNPHSPPRRVVYGPSSTDEMGDLWIQGVTNSVPDL